MIKIFPRSFCFGGCFLCVGMGEGVGWENLSIFILRLK
jgi:hypothetical protein